MAVRFGLGALDRDPEYVARGAMGQIWRLDAAAHSYAVKVLFHPVPHGSRPLDIEVQAKAAAATCLNFLMVMANQALERDEHLAFAEKSLGRILGGGMASLRASIAVLGDLLVGS